MHNHTWLPIKFILGHYDPDDNWIKGDHLSNELFTVEFFCPECLNNLVLTEDLTWEIDEAHTTATRQLTAQED